jgi:NAD(P)-dependent dehydrogenase (short-subunit alcohol dehydrogenase family)
MEVQGRSAIIVGGASGMARATAEAFVKKGGKVAIVDLPSSAGAEVAAQLGGKFYAADATDYDGMEATLKKAIADLGSVQFCVNTAGGGIAQRTLGKDGPHPLDKFRRVIDLNLVNSFNVARIVAEAMNRNEPNASGERGVIVMTASIAAFEGQIGQVAYSAAKSGIVGMTFTMARDLGSMGIRVVSIAPSLFQTGGTKRITKEMEVALVKDNAFPKRMGKPEEYAQLAISIYENAMLNGGTIRLDAGQRFGPK